jgi:hypothetical protein
VQVIEETRAALQGSGLDTLRLFIAAPPPQTQMRRRRQLGRRAGTDLRTLFDCDHALFHFRCKQLWADEAGGQEEQQEGQEEQGQGRGALNASTRSLRSSALSSVGGGGGGGGGGGAGGGGGGRPQQPRWLRTVEVVEVSTGQLERAGLGLGRPATHAPDDGGGGGGDSWSAAYEALGSATEGLVPVLAHGSRHVCCGAAAISEYLEETFDPPHNSPVRLTPNLELGQPRVRSHCQHAGLMPAARRRRRRRGGVRARD